MESKAPSSLLSNRPPSSLARLPSGPGSGKSGITAKTGTSVCVFWLQGKCYAVDVAYVGEVVAFPSVTPVPLAPVAVIGVFNLRGSVLAIVDLAAVLNLAADSTTAPVKSGTVLVLRTAGMLAGARIDRAEAIYPFDAATFQPRADQGDHPAVLGLLPVAVKKLVATLLDGEVLIKRLEALQFNKNASVTD